VTLDFRVVAGLGCCVWFTTDGQMPLEVETHGHSAIFTSVDTWKCTIILGIFVSWRDFIFFGFKIQLILSEHASLGLNFPIHKIG
jgi:hypothetical protein